MKQYRPIIVLIVIAGLIWLKTQLLGSGIEDRTLQSDLAEITVSPTPITESSDTTRMAYSYKTGIEAKRLRLIPNLDPGLTATQAAIRETCSFLVSGGFYDPDLKPLGWLVAEGRELSPPAANRLFNGYVSVGYDGLLSISDRPVGIKVRFGLQSGPLLISNGNPLKLALVRDKPARRVVMFATDHGEAGFMVFYQPGFELSGPRLADLPELLHTTAETENLDIASAINLDGGSASAFISDEVNLKETDHVGEWWCVEPL